MIIVSDLVVGNVRVLRRGGSGRGRVSRGRSWTGGGEAVELTYWVAAEREPTKVPSAAP